MKKESSIDNAIKQFLQTPPNEQDLMNYIEDKCDIVNEARLEAHLRRFPEYREEVNELKEWLKDFEKDEKYTLSTVSSLPNAAKPLDNFSEAAQILIRGIKNLVLFTPFSSYPGRAHATSADQDFKFTFIDENFYGFSSIEEDGSLEIQVFTPIMDFEGGLVILQVNTDTFTKVLFKRGNKIGATFLLPASFREKADPDAKLKVAEIIPTDYITHENIQGLNSELNEMKKSTSINKRWAAEKILRHLETLH